MIRIWKGIFEFGNKIMKSNVVKAFAILKTVSDKVKKEIEDFKKKVRDVAIISIFAFIGLLFLLIGLGFYLESKYAALSGGRGFLLIGAISLLLSILYWLISK